MNVDILKELRHKLTKELDGKMRDLLNSGKILGPKMTKFRVGYWRATKKSSDGKRVIVNFPDCPDVHDFIDPSWDINERQMVIDYIKKGKIKHSWMGSSTCRICGKRGNGSSCLTDGTWVWPEGLSHYLEEHNVKPPREFINRVKSKI
jgi:hypothetical protein